MPILEPAEAAYFCSGYVKNRHPQVSFRNWSGSLTTGTRFEEGHASFERYRDYSLSEVERLLLLSASHYRRAHDLLGEVTAAWAHVTLYYGSFFASSALLGLFGNWVTGKHVVGVSLTTPGALEFAVRRYSSPSGARSHAKFWEFYYAEMAALVPYLTPLQQIAVVPAASFDWQSQNRNLVNYDTYEAISLSSRFQAGFSTAGFPGSLPGVLSTQYQNLECVLELAVNYAEAFGIDTDAVDSICALPTRRARVREMVVERKPRALGNRARKRVIGG